MTRHRDSAECSLPLDVRVHIHIDINLDVTSLAELERLVPLIELLLAKSGPPVRFIFLENGKELGTMFQMSDIQKVDLTVKAVDAKGNDAVLPSPPSWSVSDPAILSITPAADGMSASIAAVGPEGNCQVRVAADLGDQQQASGTLDVTIVGSAATSIQVTPGTPTNQ